MYVPKLQPITRSIIDLVSLNLVVECGIHGPVEYQSRNLNNIAVLKQLLASFQYLRNFFPLDTEVFVLNLFWYPEVLYICVFPLLFCFQWIRQRILRFSNIQCCLALNRRFRFRSVVPDLCHRISYGTLHWYKFKFTRLAHWLDHWPNVSLLLQNPISLEPTNLHLDASILFRIKLNQCCVLIQ